MSVLCGFTCFPFRSFVFTCVYFIYQFKRPAVPRSAQGRPIGHDGILDPFGLFPGASLNDAGKFFKADFFIGPSFIVAPDRCV
jgi:hypothetical protein